MADVEVLGDDLAAGGFDQGLGAGELPVSGGFGILKVLGRAASGEGEADHGRTPQTAPRPRGNRPRRLHTLPERRLRNLPFTALHPDHERLAQHAIRLYQTAGRHDAARHTYTRLERHLADLGLEPEPATQALIATRTQGRNVRWNQPVSRF
ncbi:bacterial transcriptional activator domain-containing protein [Streptomyces glomeratus]|uniref:bacterial transcriptional activator domain-containing protein n=1 Tax=Streptomyces glomeratus TaxID=284452 RepID=UPI001F1AF936|nr:bacterial transcriptional activator domain-containing protein [Streptomyces glomeratus]MCF1509081.1 bacterial transcriptional activator domain-containing protein [Streptomyces glomeratus]